MPRHVTLFTGQWADLPLASLAPMARSFGYDGLELACWGDHFDVEAALSSDAYCRSRHDLLAQHGLKTWAISNHLVGQAVCDIIDERHKLILPPRVWGDGKPEGVRQRAAAEMIATAQAAAALGVKVVNGFTGSSVWHKLYFFPPTGPSDIHAARRAFAALRGRPAFGFNFDPSHLQWQGVDSVKFIRAFPDRIYHCHIKDCIRTIDGETSILGSHLSFGDPRPERRGVPGAAERGVGGQWHGP